MRGRYKALIVAIVLGAPRCSTDPPCSNHTAPHATFDVTRGCVGYYCAMSCDAGFADCNGTQSDGCETSTTTGLPPNTTLDTNTFGEGGGCMSGGGETIGSIGQCNIQCKPGFFDCDKNKANGCETPSLVGCAGDAAPPDSPSGPHRIATLASAPRGLVACAGSDYFFDGSDLRAVDSVALFVLDIVTSPAPPVDGLACDGSNVFWATSSPGDAAAGGAIYGVSTFGGPALLVASGLDPTPGIDVRSDGLFVMSSGGLLALQADGGLGPWMPAASANAYKPFTLGATDEWSIAGGSILHHTSDAGTSTWVDDAGSPTTVVTADGQPIASIHTLEGDAGPISDSLARLRDDAGAATLSPIFTVAQPIVATASGPKAIAASDETIYVVTPAQVLPLYTTTDHIVDVAIDGKWVVWTTRGQGSSPAGVFRGALP